MKKLLIGGLVALGGLGLMSGGNDSVPGTTQNLVSPPAVVTEVAAPEVKQTAPTETTVVEKNAVPKAVQPAPAVVDTPTPCGSDYYRNVDGNCVHRPQAAPSAPIGASARCRDGTYSYSQNHRGTCSHHGGVASWL